MYESFAWMYISVPVHAMPTEMGEGHWTPQSWLQMTVYLHCRTPYKVAIPGIHVVW